MPRLQFSKTGDAVWFSHLDLMRVFQRSFKRAGLSLSHTQGFNPRPSVSIALPLSVGVESLCELLDFDLEGDIPSDNEILNRLNAALVPGVRVLEVYHDGKKLKELTHLQCKVYLEYDNGVPKGAADRIKDLFSADTVIVTKKTKNGLQDQNIIPMIKSIDVIEENGNTLVIDAIICCQNPTLNPAQITVAIGEYLPDIKPDFCTFRRIALYNSNNENFR